jgi:hypothetical protein
MELENLNLPLAFGIIGFLFSTKAWLIFINKLNPIIGLVMYYIILIMVIVLLEHFGLIVSGLKLDTISHTIGLILIVFAFFITMDWQSCYVRAITNNPCKKDTIYLQTEDGLVYYLWSRVFTNLEVLRIMTYVITPMVLALIGTFLITDDPHISPFKLPKIKI